MADSDAVAITVEGDTDTEDTENTGDTCTGASEKQPIVQVKPGYGAISDQVGRCLVKLDPFRGSFLTATDRRDILCKLLYHYPVSQRN